VIDLHTHTLLSDGELLPSELARRAEVEGYRAVAFTDHVDHANLDWVLERTLEVCRAWNRRGRVRAVAGVEITHVHPRAVAELVTRAREQGAQIVVVHGETLAEPVASGTNRAAVEAAADILAHPGLLTEEEAVLAAEKGVHLEITCRHGHALANGHVARLARRTAAPLLVNTDAHGPGDLVDRAGAEAVLRGAGLEPPEAVAVLRAAARLLERLA